MSLDEFGIIRRHFVRNAPVRDDVVAGIGDDAALLQVPAGHELVVCTDTLVAGRHFPETTAPAAIGYKALAVNLSDLAAMGAEPAWVTLALTLPGYDEPWMSEFMQGFFRLADRCNVALVGGDTTRGPLSITVQAQGFVPSGQALMRHGAQPGDHIYVTGTLGDAGLALYLGEQADGELRQRLDYPEPRLQAGQVLRGLATSAIDISDGLLADLGHLLEADRLGASIETDLLPRSAAFENAIRQAGADAESLAHDLPLSAGDDYELCFTAPAADEAVVMAAFAPLECGCTRIGVIEQQPGIRCLRANAIEYLPAVTGYNHFDDPDG
jgi:thiamine-monophosphate kinase